MQRQEATVCITGIDVKSQVTSRLCRIAFLVMELQPTSFTAPSASMDAWSDSSGDVVIAIPTPARDRRAQGTVTSKNVGVRIIALTEILTLGWQTRQRLPMCSVEQEGRFLEQASTRLNSGWVWSSITLSFKTVRP